MSKMGRWEHRSVAQREEETLVRNAANGWLGERFLLGLILLAVVLVAEQGATGSEIRSAAGAERLMPQRP